MAGNYSFRSSMNGFNRNDVMACIEDILNEKNAVEIKVASLETRIAELEEKCSVLEKDKSELISEKDIKTAACEKQNSQIAELEKQLSDADSEIENLRFQLSKVNEASSEKEKCAECDLARVYEARLGAAMFDAKRFSEILVKEANDKAASLFASAYSSAGATSEKAKEISAEISEINKQFNASFSKLIENMHNLDKSLEGFMSDVKTTESAYSFSTDFEPIKYNPSLDVNAQSHKSDAAGASDTEKADEIPMPHNIDVNFDDADEFDIKVDLNAWKKY